MVREREYLLQLRVKSLRSKESKIVTTEKAKKSITVVTIKENSQPQYFSLYHFLRKNEIMNYFY